ncbi:uncharacterized protein LOC113342991 [Papaver somniferum]|uniref:uncharacterized protein LOC113342991 n=1 Tax=Papaver somniferum TaxID=3469 RepID=UPI000E702794|nr:uncharacterized protein LOC113342991 [Papaver somniferum]
MCCWETKSGFWVSQKNFRLELIMFISGPCIVGAEGVKRSIFVSCLITGYSLPSLHNNILISVSYYKPKFEKTFVVDIRKLFGCVRGNIDENVKVGIWIINKLLPHSQDPVAHKQHYQKFSTHVAATTHNSVKYHITRVIMLEPEEVKLILDIELYNLSTNSNTILSRWYLHKLLTVRRKNLVKYIALEVEYHIVNHQQNLKQLKLSRSNGISTREKEMTVDSMLPANTFQESSTRSVISVRDSVEGYINRFIMHKLELNTLSVEKDKKLELIHISKKGIFSVRVGNEEFSVIEDNLKIYVDGSTGSEVRSMIHGGTHTVNCKAILGLLLMAMSDVFTSNYQRVGS